MESLKPWPKPRLLVAESCFSFRIFASTTVQFTVKFNFSLKIYFANFTVTYMATERVRRQINPSSRLTADSNAAQPALTSHRVSIALAQAKRTADTAQITRDVTVASDQPEQQSEPLPPITPTTASRASTIPPTTSDPDSEDSDHTSTAAKKKKTEETTRKACTKTIRYVIKFIRYSLS